MPQEELWAASARSTGFTMTYQDSNHFKDGTGLVVFRPTWSKRPSGRDGGASLRLPNYAAWHLPEVFRAAWDQYLGGDPKFVGPTAQVTLQGVLESFADGARM